MSAMTCVPPASCWRDRLALPTVHRSKRSCPVRSAKGLRHQLLSYEDRPMLFTIALILVILWALGFFVVHVGGGLIHALLVIALIVIVYRLLTGQRVA